MAVLVTNVIIVIINVVVCIIISVVVIIIIISVPDCGSPEGEGRPGMHGKKIHAQVFLSSCLDG